MKTLVTLIFLLAQVYSHGFSSYPIARQARCYKNADYYWPPNGIKDPGCKKAYDHVKSKGKDGVTQFIQLHEVAALAGSNYNDTNHIKNVVVPKNLCGANANGQNGFGDKSGLSVIANWTPTLISGNKLDLEFCASAPHVPSYWEIYISKNNYNPTLKELTWSDLELHQKFTGIQPKDKSSGSTCIYGKTFNMTLENLPKRDNQFVIYVRWQRIDPVGEGFYNCIDVKYK